MVGRSFLYRGRGSNAQQRSYRPKGVERYRGRIWDVKVAAVVRFEILTMARLVCKGKGHPITCLCRHRGKKEVAPTHSQHRRSVVFTSSGRTTTPRPVWRGTEYVTSTWIRHADRPARSESLY